MVHGSGGEGGSHTRRVRWSKVEDIRSGGPWVGREGD